MVNIPDFGKKKNDAVPYRGKKVDPNKVYENLNKLPLMVGDYRYSMMNKLKKAFNEQLVKAVLEEREYCEKRKIECAMDKAAYEDVLTTMQRCKTIFEMEALARFVFDDNEIPTYDMVQRRGLLLDNSFPVKLKH